MEDERGREKGTLEYRFYVGLSALDARVARVILAGYIFYNVVFHSGEAERRDEKDH